MTDKEKLDAIRAEIHRLIDVRGYDREMANNLLTFMDSLPNEPEPQFKVGDTIRSKHWDTAVHKIISMDDKSYHLDNGGKVDISSQQLWELVKEPVNEEWIEELRTKLDSMSKEEFEQAWGKYKVKEIEEPVSEDLEKAAVEAFKQIVDSDKNNFLEIFKAGAKWQEEYLWKPADGDDQPEIDREVIALLNNGKVVFAHRPPEYWDGKDIVTGKVTRNYPKTYDKGGWNIPNIVYWLDVELPKEIEL